MTQPKPSRATAQALRAPVYTVANGRRVLDTGRVQIGLRAGEPGTARPAPASADADRVMDAIARRRPAPAAGTQRQPILAVMAGNMHPAGWITRPRPASAANDARGTPGAERRFKPVRPGGEPVPTQPDVLHQLHRMVTPGLTPGITPNLTPSIAPRVPRHRAPGWRALLRSAGRTAGIALALTACSAGAGVLVYLAQR